MRALLLVSAIPLLPLQAGAQAGALDPTFNGDGIGLYDVDFPVYDQQTTAMAARPDGSVVIVVNGLFSHVDAVASILPDGQLDTTFGDNGATYFPYVESAGLTCIALQPDGKVVVAGGDAPPGFFTGHWLITRLNIDGSVDQTFGDTGSVYIDFDPAEEHDQDIVGIRVLPDGRIIVGGEAAIPGDDFGWAVARLLPDGSFDPTFDGDGWAHVHVQGSAVEATDMIMGSDGELLVCGKYSDEPDDGAALARFDTNGAFDTGMGVVYFPGIRPEAIASDTLGRIIITGRIITDPHPFTMRLLNDGTLDNSFGMGGLVVDGIITYGFAGYAVVLGPNGSITTIARSQGPDSTSLDMVVIRYDSTGVRDAGWGMDGAVYVDPTGLQVSDDALCMIRDQQGRLLVGGEATAIDLQTVVLRFLDGDMSVGLGATDQPGVSLAPNPAADHLRIDVPGGSSEDMEITITDPLGRVVLFAPLDRSRTIRIAQLRAGAYLATISDRSGRKRTVRRFVKE